MPTMNRNEFLLQMDEILDLPAGTLRGNEKLEELTNWDSTSLITFIAMAESSEWREHFAGRDRDLFHGRRSSSVGSGRTQRLKDPLNLGGDSNGIRD